MEGEEKPFWVDKNQGIEISRKIEHDLHIQKLDDYNIDASEQGVNQTKVKQGSLRDAMFKEFEVIKE
jgi:hypothetical protein